MSGGRRVLVTGSTRGIGRAIAERFLAAGDAVILHGSSQTAVTAVVTELQTAYPTVSGHAADLSDRAALRGLAQVCGPIDVLINNAGLYAEEAIDAVSPASWNRMMAVNLTAAWLLSSAFLPGLRARRGSIVNVASDAAFLGVAGGSTYCASKGALVGLTRALAIELAPHVRALCVCPGPVETDMMRNQVEAAPDPVAMRAQWMGFAPMGRVARPEEIAALVYTAADPAAGFATGAAWLIDGGLTAGKRLS
ncbi:MAG: SDR family NAD(P)-dependent oxidoreductase [Labrys sp. (in: a-proteobacteria)]